MKIDESCCTIILRIKESSRICNPRKQKGTHRDFKFCNQWLCWGDETGGGDRTSAVDARFLERVWEHAPPRNFLTLGHFQAGLLII